MGGTSGPAFLFAEMLKCFNGLYFEEFGGDASGGRSLY